jgi:AcrR family transcriptional regulator
VSRRTSPPETLNPRAREIVAAARALLEEAGPDGLTLRALAARLGIRAPSLYNHFPDKASLETVLIASGLFELALTLEAAMREAPDPIEAVAFAYRGYARRHPYLYRLMTDRPLPHERLPDGLQTRAFAPLLAVSHGDADRAVALRAFLHGMVHLELSGAMGSDDADRAWQVGLPR